MGSWPAFWWGVRSSPSPAAVVLIASFVGFGALAQGSGFSIPQSVAIGAAMWALPGQVVLVTQITGGASVLAAAVAVTLTSVRLMPLVVTLMPMLRTSRTSTAMQLLAAHFCAITIWVESMLRLPAIPRTDRMPFYMGFASFLLFTNLMATVAGHTLAAELGPVARAALLFLTPLYFTLSMLRASGGLGDKLALLFGLLLGPIIFLALPGFELVLTGLIGGSLAYIIDRRRRRAT